MLGLRDVADVQTHSKTETDNGMVGLMKLYRLLVSDATNR